MEVLVYLACLVLVFPYVLMAYASIKIHKEIKEVLSTSKDDLALPTTL
jgi:uncharacterized membrane protein